MFLYKIFFGIFIITSCSTYKPKGKSQDEILFNEALHYSNKDQLVLANDTLREIKAKFPYSPFAQKAQLEIGNIAFKQENYVEAIIAYQTYRELYPSSPNMDYILFMLGESFLNQLPSTYDRDLEEAHQAIAYYQHLISHFPNSQYRTKAQEQKKKCEEMLRNKEKYIADFYFKTHVYEGARFRYKKILKTFDDEGLLQHSMLRALESSLRLKDKKTCLKDGKIFKKVLKNQGEQARTKISVQSMINQCKEL